MKKIFISAILLFGLCNMYPVESSTFSILGSFKAYGSAPNKGDYMRTSQSVSIYSESGNYKGSYSVYLHKGQRYIDFNNTWICIQGKQRFSYKGVYYIIK